MELLPSLTEIDAAANELSGLLPRGTTTVALISCCLAASPTDWP